MHNSRASSAGWRSGYCRLRSRWLGEQAAFAPITGAVAAPSTGAVGKQAAAALITGAVVKQAAAALITGAVGKQVAAALITGAVGEQAAFAPITGAVGKQAAAALITGAVGGQVVPIEVGFVGEQAAAVPVFPGAGKSQRLEDAIHLDHFPLTNVVWIRWDDTHKLISDVHQEVLFVLDVSRNGLWFRVWRQCACCGYLRF